jgi:GNAT superfamily N-acetyltransferase
MIIRRLEAADAKDYKDLRLRGLEECQTAFGSSYAEEVDTPLEKIAEQLADDKGGFTLGAFGDEGALVGITGFRREAREKSRHKGWVWGVYVAPEARGHGIAGALLDETIRRAREMPGLRKINLAVCQTQKAAAKVYRSHGFVAWGMEPEALAAEGRYFAMEFMSLELVE